MSNENELLPCPLCSSGDVYHENTITEAVVRCCNCGLSLKHANGPMADEGVASVKSVWNTRRRPILTDEAVERAIEAWCHIIGLIPDQHLPITRYDKDKDGGVTDILIPFGDTMMQAMRAALTAAFSPPPGPTPSYPPAEQNDVTSHATPSSLVPVEAVGWQPIETMKGDGPAWFWLDWADDCAKLNPPMSWDSRERIHYGTRGSWVSVYKATHWRVLDGPKKLIAAAVGTPIPTAPAHMEVGE